MDTPFVTQGRVGFLALDCVGLVIVSCQIAGLSPEYVSDYHFSSDYSAMLLEYMASNAAELAMDDIVPGSVLLFWLSKRHLPRHVGIVVPGSGLGTPLNFVHTSESVARVVESALDAKWQRHIHSAWGIRGLT